MKTIDCSNMPKGATHKSLGTGRWYRYESGEGAYSKGWYRSTAAGNLWVKMHMGKAAKANLVALPIGESKPTEAAYGMAPLKVEGGSYVPFPEKPKATTPLATQVGGGHYKDLKIQPVEYIHANDLPFIEGCVVKYVTRHRAKNGKADIEKAIHFLQILLELEYGSAPKEKGDAPKELKEQDERPRQTRRQQLIAAGIPAHEFDGITDSMLDEPADDRPSRSLEQAFVWQDTAQGKEHWEKWESLLD
jgi:hypothetical protein